MHNMVSFGETCNLQNGKAFKPSDWSDNGTPIVRIQNLNDESKPFNYCNVPVEKRFHITSGDLLFSWSGTPGTSFGAFFWHRGEAYLNQHIFKVTTDDAEIDKNYLRYAINSKLKQIIDQAHGGVGLKHITKGKLEAIQIPLPPLPEQKRIAAILDKADAIRRKRQQAIDLADEFLRSVFLDMFGDPVTNPKGWDMKPISEVSIVTTGNTPSRKIPENYGSYIEWIKSDNINTPKHYLTNASEYLSEQGSEKARTVSKGSVLITCIAGSKDCIGNAAIADRNVSFNQQINALTPKSTSTTEYLYSLSLFGKKLIQGASTNSMKGMVSKSNLQKLEIPAPPIEQQKIYSSKFQQYLRNKEQLEQALRESEYLFSSLSQQAFAGKI